jgi:NAD(P)-dependent dehydrogenase (short-subunit alcohol dehydrogenase family)
MTGRMDDKVVVITGASSGIGKATALAFARNGARLALCARRQPELNDTVKACREAGVQVVELQTDVADEAQVKALAQRAIEAFGRIDVWFNNAGVDAFGPFLDIPSAAFERVLQVNLMGTVYGSRAALTQFRQQGCAGRSKIRPPGRQNFRPLRRPLAEALADRKARVDKALRPI